MSLCTYELFPHTEEAPIIMHETDHSLNIVRVAQYAVEMSDYLRHHPQRAGIESSSKCAYTTVNIGATHPCGLLLGSDRLSLLLACLHEGATLPG